MMLRKVFLLVFLFICGCSFIDQRGGEYKLETDEGMLVDKMIIDKCSVPTGFACVDYSIGKDGVNVLLKNSMGTDMEEFYVAFYCGKSNETMFNNGDVFDFFVPCVLVEGSQFESEMILLYKDAYSGIEHRKEGKLMGRVR